MNEVNKEEKKKSSLMDDLKVVISAVVIALIIRNFVFNLAVVNQTSMFPTLYPKYLVLVDRIVDWTHNYKRGQIVIFKSPEDNKNLIKRLIGEPGDEVHIEAGKVYVNGKELDENYLQEGVYTDSYDENTWKLGKDEYFLMGDNRPGSYDCRNFGPIKEKALIGATKNRIYPFKDFGKIDK